MGFKSDWVGYLIFRNKLQYDTSAILFGLDEDCSGWSGASEKEYGDSMEGRLVLGQGPCSHWNLVFEWYGLD